MTASLSKNQLEKIAEVIKMGKLEREKQLRKEEEGLKLFYKDVELLHKNSDLIKQLLDINKEKKEIAELFGVSQKAVDYAKVNYFDSVKGFVELKDNDPEELEMIIPGLPLGYVGSFSAAGGVGKSTFMFQMMCQIASGVNITGIETGRGKVAYLPAEDDETSARHKITSVTRMKQFSDQDRANLDANVYIKPLVGMSPNLTNKETLDMIKAAAMNRELLVIDTFAAFSAGENPNETAFTGQAVQNLISIAAQTNCAIIFIGHVNKESQKSGKMDSQAAVKGNAALVDNTRFAAYLIEMSEDDAIKYGIKNEDREEYVQMGVSKVNLFKKYKQWYKRISGEEHIKSHVFMPISFDEDESKKETITVKKSIKKRREGNYA